MFRNWLNLVVVPAAAIAALCIAHLALAAKPEQPENARSPYEQCVQRAVGYLQTTGQSADGSFSAQSGPAVTAIVATALLRNGRSPDDPLVAKSLQYLEKFVRTDGGIYSEKSTHQNYETSIAIQCFAAANRKGRYDGIIKAADKFIRNLQWDEGEGHDRSSVNFGGGGYGKSKRPDLSNTSFLIDALKAAGASADDKAVQDALVFVSRCQNLETEHNTTPFAAKNPDGGLYYTPAAGGQSQAGKTPEGGLRSYGSMTYAGLKSMIFAGLGPDDPRVQAAYKWVQQHYDLDANPGMGNAGLYYYYHTFAKALDAVGDDTIEDANGQRHDWRSELVAELSSRQRMNGSWVNENARWLEGDANLVTGYALLALSYCRPAAKAAK